MIVDVHTHVFAQVQGCISSGQTKGIGYGRVLVCQESLQLMPPLCRETTHTPEMLIAHMDWAGVDKAVLLQGPFYGECNDYVLQATEKHPDRLWGSAYIDPWEKGAQEVFEQGIADTGFRAVKLEMSEPTGFAGVYPGVSLSDRKLEWLWEQLERWNLILVLDLGGVGSASYQTEAVRRIAEEHPALRIVVAHLGQPTPAVFADPQLRRMWEEQIDLGLLGNVWFDTASIPAYLSGEDFPYMSAVGIMRIALDRIGAGKIMWGTDIPGALSHATYPQLLKAIEIHISALSTADREQIMGGNAIEVFTLNA